MRLSHLFIILACSFGCIATQVKSYGDDLKPYPLTPESRARIEDLAASSDVLILGEVHGTQEVPELVASLLKPLNEAGYHVLALEVPNNEQAALLAWARGESKKVPEFFANPNGDGIGNAQLLALTRMAASPPYRWRIVCFDESESPLENQVEQPGARQLTDDEIDADWRKRDATMATNLLREAKSPRTTSRIVAVCGNLHARTKNVVQEPMLTKLWPSFAAVLKQRQPEWRVGSVDVQFHSGAFFNDGKVQTIGRRPLKQAEVRSGDQTGYDLVLSLPAARPATMLGKQIREPDGPATKTK